MPLSRIKYLLERYYAGTCTPEEMQELDNWYESLDLGNAVQPGYADQQEEEKDRQREIFFRDFTERLTAGERNGSGIIRRISPLKKWIRIAAIFIGIGCIGAYLWRHRPAGQQVVALQQFTDDVQPGGNRAILTLANGSRIMLDSARNGTLAQQGNAKVLKLDSGRLSYQLSSTGHQSFTVDYNMVSTPRGGQYQVVLADGSKVWLNAASSLRFPTAFAGKDREVEIYGEAYFEIAEDASRPFKVHISSRDGSDKGTVQVLGTHFNINAYADESSVKTTLLEGAVKILKGNAALILSPREQAVLNGQGELKLAKDIDVDQAVAWKNGLFQFEGSDIQSVMRQISRWYNIEVKYEGNIPDHFVGTISRNVNVSKVFKMLELAGDVHFKIEGRSVTVSL